MSPLELPCRRLEVYKVREKGGEGRVYAMKLLEKVKIMGNNLTRSAACFGLHGDSHRLELRRSILGRNDSKTRLLSEVRDDGAEHYVV